MTPSLGRRSLRGLLTGVVLAAGAPMGLGALRALRSGVFSAAGLWADVAGDKWTYAYVTASTAVAFGLFGLSLGRQADRLLALSNSDVLTGLQNRRALSARLEEEFGRATRYEQPLSFLLIDVDRLKHVNDTAGHRAGDEALRRAALAVHQGSRATDLTARWGGDEFALLAPSTDREAGLRLGERIRSLLAEDREGLVTVSVGVATHAPQRPFPSTEALVGAADQALYAAKSGGRNRVMSL